MRTLIIILVFISITSCNSSSLLPTDKEMIHHFNTHEMLFNKVLEIITNRTKGSFHYPSLSSDNIIISDSTEQQSNRSIKANTGDLSIDWMQLNSLLETIGVGFILVDRQEQKLSGVIKLSIVMSYSFATNGTSKSFVYDPSLKNRSVTRITEHGDLSEIYRNTHNDTTLYKLIKGNWYIKLAYER